jgi:hypothetical protein
MTKHAPYQIEMFGAMPDGDIVGAILRHRRLTHIIDGLWDAVLILDDHPSDIDAVLAVQDAIDVLSDLVQPQ